MGLAFVTQYDEAQLSRAKWSEVEETGSQRGRERRGYRDTQRTCSGGGTGAERRLCRRDVKMREGRRRRETEREGESADAETQRSKEQTRIGSERDSRVQGDTQSDKNFRCKAKGPRGAEQMETEGDKVLGKKPKTIMRRRGKRQDDEQLETEAVVSTAEIRGGGSARKETSRWPCPPELGGGQQSTCTESRASLGSGVGAQASAPRASTFQGSGDDRPGGLAGAQL